MHQVERSLSATSPGGADRPGVDGAGQGSGHYGALEQRLTPNPSKVATIDRNHAEEAT